MENNNQFIIGDMVELVNTKNKHYGNGEPPWNDIKYSNFIKKGSFGTLGEPRYSNFVFKEQNGRVVKIDGDKIIVGIYWNMGSEPHPYQPSFLNDEFEDDKYYEMYERGCMCESSDIELCNSDSNIRKYERKICDKRKSIQKIEDEIEEDKLTIKRISKRGEPFDLNLSLMEVE